MGSPENTMDKFFKTKVKVTLKEAVLNQYQQLQTSLLMFYKALYFTPISFNHILLRFKVTTRLVNTNKTPHKNPPNKTQTIPKQNAHLLEPI